MSTTFDVLSRCIEDNDESYEDLGENPLQREEVDAKQATRFNSLNHMKTLVQIEPMITFGNGVQGFGPIKPLLT